MVNGKVISKEKIARDFCHLKVKIDGDYVFDAGQFALLTFNIEGNKETRAYSIASPPYFTKQNHILEFGIKKKMNGKVSTYVCEKLKKGEIIEISKSNGHMTLKNAPTKDFVFIAVGSGIVPFRSIILELINTKEYDSITLVYGNKYKEDIAYHDLFFSLSKEYKNFNYYVVLSREQETPLSFYKGHVQDVLFNFKERELINKNNTYFICGVPAMVSDVRKRLIERGIPSNNILFEGF